MPRSLAEFNAQMPEVKLVPFPVPSEERNPPAWQTFRRLHGEYAKFLASLVRITFQGLTAAQRRMILYVRSALFLVWFSVISVALNVVCLPLLIFPWRATVWAATNGRG
jgi:hypothetical protein